VLDCTILCIPQDSLSLHDLQSTDRHLLGISSVKSLKSNVCRAVTTQNVTANNFVISHAHAITALRFDVILNGIHRLLVTVNELSVFPSQKNCQGQLKAPLSVSYTIIFTLLQFTLVYVFGHHLQSSEPAVRFE